MAPTPFKPPMRVSSPKENVYIPSSVNGRRQTEDHTKVHEPHYLSSSATTGSSPIKPNNVNGSNVTKQTSIHTTDRTNDLSPIHVNWDFSEPDGAIINDSEAESEPDENFTEAKARLTSKVVPTESALLGELSQTLHKPTSVNKDINNNVDRDKGQEGRDMRVSVAQKLRSTGDITECTKSAYSSNPDVQTLNTLGPANVVQRTRTGEACSGKSNTGKDTVNMSVSGCIPENLLVRLLHHGFKYPTQTKIDRGAITLISQHVDAFVNEAMTRAAVVRKRAEAQIMTSDVSWEVDGFLQVEDLEKIVPQLLLDF